MRPQHSLTRKVQTKCLIFWQLLWILVFKQKVENTKVKDWSKLFFYFLKRKLKRIKRTSPNWFGLV